MKTCIKMLSLYKVININVKKKGKVVPVLLLTEHHAMKAYWGSRGIAPLILLPRHLKKVSGQLHAPAALPPGKELLVSTG
jgi:hypothetical protein